MSNEQAEKVADEQARKARDDAQEETCENSDAESGELPREDDGAVDECGEQTKASDTDADAGDEKHAGEDEDRVSVLQAEVEQLKERLLRSQAEMENIRRRSQKELADARKFAIERFATELLDVLDNLERALAVEEGNEAALRDGIRMTLESWHGVMGKFEMQRIDAVGKKFDPHLHEALSRVPNEAEEGTVIAQHCAGYTLHGRLIRPARVLVSSGGS